MSFGSVKSPVIAGVVTLMITPHGTSQAPAASKTVKPRKASSGRAYCREAASGMATEDPSTRSRPDNNKTSSDY